MVAGLVVFLCLLYCCVSVFDLNKVLFFSFFFNNLSCACECVHVHLSGDDCLRVLVNVRVYFSVLLSVCTCIPVESLT